MKLELLIFGTTAFFIANAYHDGKYMALIKSWKKYYQMAFYGFLGFSLYLFIKRHPDQSHNLLKHANGIIKYMPIDRDATDMLTPIFSFTKDGFQNQGDNRGVSRILTSGGASGASGGPTKRSVSETKKKFVASNQHWKCGDCQKQLNAWFEVDHKIRLEHGGSNHVDNLVALCRDCHGKKTTMENLG